MAEGVESISDELDRSKANQERAQADLAATQSELEAAKTGLAIQRIAL